MCLIVKEKMCFFKKKKNKTDLFGYYRRAVIGVLIVEGIVVLIPTRLISSELLVYLFCSWLLDLSDIGCVTKLVAMLIAS